MLSQTHSLHTETLITWSYHISISSKVPTHTLCQGWGLHITLLSKLFPVIQGMAPTKSGECMQRGSGSGSSWWTPDSFQHMSYHTSILVDPDSVLVCTEQLDIAGTPYARSLSHQSWCSLHCAGTIIWCLGSDMPSWLQVDLSMWLLGDGIWLIHLQNLNSFQMLVKLLKTIFTVIAVNKWTESSE